MLQRPIRRRVSRPVAALTGAVVLVLALAACASDSGGGSGSDGTTEYNNLSADIPGLDKGTVTKACAEGQLQMFQINVTPSANDVVADFKKLVPCLKLNVVQASGAELAQRFTTGQRTGDVPDYFENSDPGILERFAKSGSFLKFDPPEAGQVTSPSPGLWWPEYGIAMGFLYRPDRVTPAQVAKLTTWAGVVDPSFANTKMAVISPAAGGTPLVSFYDMTKTNGAGFIKQLGRDKITVFPASRPAGESIASGESDMAWPFAMTTALELLGNKAPVRLAFPRPVDTIPVGSAIPKQAEHPNAAKLFISYMLSPTVQKMYSTKNGGIPTNKSVSFTNDVTSQSWWKLPTEQFHYDPAEVTSASNNVISVFKNQFNG